MSLVRQTIAVTGASGFVGQRLIRRLLDAGEKLLVLTRSPSRWEGVRGIEALPWDLESGKLEVEVLREVKALCHLAAYLPADFSDLGEAEHCFRANALGSLDLMEAAVAAGVPVMIDVSSGNTYANRGKAAREVDPQYPSSQASAYLVSKLAQEIFVSHLGAAVGRVVTFRPSAVYGPGMPSRGVLYAFADRLLRGESIELQDGGRYGVDFVFVDDVVEAVRSALEREVSGAFNLGSGVRTSVLELAEEMADLLSLDRSLLHVHPESTKDPEAGFAPLDPTRARELLDWHPRPFREGLRDYLAWLEAGSP